MELLQFLNENVNWQSQLTADPYHLRIQHLEPFYLLQYQQFVSDFNLKLVQEARGCIVIEESGKWHYVCKAMDKFFNAGELYAEETLHNFNWNNCHAEEKIDGSLVKIWYYGDTWHISTNGSIDAGNCFTAYNKSYLDLINSTVGIEKLIEGLDINYCYWFELVGPENRIVVPYKEAALYYLGCRNTATWEECNFIPKLPSNVKFPQRCAISCLDDVISMAAQLTTIEKEGFVVVDDRWNRLKVKGEAYVAAHRMRANNLLTPKLILEMWRTNSLDDYMALYPEHNSIIGRVMEQVAAMAEICDKWYFISISNSNERKEIAQFLSQNCPPFARSYVFTRLDNKVETAIEFLRNYKNLERLINCD